MIMFLPSGMSLIVWLFLLPDLYLSQTENLNRLTSGPIGGYMSLDEALAYLRELVDKYPHLISREVIGKTFEGRDILSYRVSAIEKSSAHPPRLLLTSLMHAREPITLTASLFIISELVHEFEAHVTDVEYLLKTRELYIIPVVNPDAYSRLTTATGFRKNARNTCVGRPEDSGVDLNRNFAYDWKPVANGCSEEYSGFGPFSEPETQAIRDLAIAKKFSSAVHFHAYGNILTIPYNGGEGRKEVHVDHMRFYEEIQAAWKFDTFGPSPKTLNYSTSGESDDWLYDTLGVLSLSPELGSESDGFRPTPDRVTQVLLDIYPKMKLWMMRAGGPQIDSTRVQPQADSEWMIEFENRGLVPLDESTIVVRDGGVCSSCQDSGGCSVVSDGRVRVFTGARPELKSIAGLGKWVIPRCQKEVSNLRAEYVDICFVQSQLNCRCFRSPTDGSQVVFDKTQMSNYFANIALCESAGITKFTEAISPYGSDSSNWFGFCSNVLLLVLVIAGMVRILREVRFAGESPESRRWDKPTTEQHIEQQIDR